MSGEKFFYDTTDNIKLCGILNKVNADGKIIIMCHGIRGNKDERNSFTVLANRLYEEGYNSFRFDFRAHGESSGIDCEMTITKEIEDLKSTIEMLKGKGFKRFVLLGASFGASIISLLPKEKYEEVEGLILWYGALDYDYIKFGDYFSEENRRSAEIEGYYISTSKSTGKKFKFGKKLFDEVYTIKPYKNLVEIEIPKIFVHGKEDKAVPYELSQKINSMCKNSKLELIDEGDHTFDNLEAALNNAIEKTIEFVKNIYRNK